MRTASLRLSIDLAPVAYQRLAERATTAGGTLGRRVTHVSVLRALLEERWADPELCTRVRTRLESDGN